MAITTFDRPTVNTLAKELEALLKPFAKERGIKVCLRSGSFTGNEFKQGVEFYLEGEGGTEGVTAGDEKAFLTYAPITGMKAEWLHQTFEMQGKIFEVVGYKPKARVNKVLIKQMDNGKVYVTGVRSVISGFEIKALREQNKEKK